MNKLLQGKLQDFIISVIAVVVALIIGGIIITYSGHDPWLAYRYLFQGAFSSTNAFAQTLLLTTPLIFTGLSVALAFQAGLFNIGAHGQLIMGGITAAAVAAFVPNIGINNLLVVLILSMGAGFLWAALAGWLKARWGVHEVISTIMLNYIANNFKLYLINYPLKEGGIAGPSPQTPQAMEWSRLPLLLPDTNVPLNLGFILALIAVVTLAYLLKKTVLGYEIKAVGFNSTSSENAGIHVRNRIILTMGICGALAGLGGAERVLGGIADYRYQEGIAAEYGFDGIAVALLGKNNPYGIVLAALLFGALRAGSIDMQLFAGVPIQLTTIIQSIIILFIAAENFFRHYHKILNFIKRS